MLRCLTPGCPSGCGTRRTPSCAERVLRNTLLVFFGAVLIVSLVLGLASLGEATLDSGRASETAPVAVSEMPELVGQSEDDRREWIGGDRDGKPELLTDALVQISE